MNKMEPLHNIDLMPPWLTGVSLEELDYFDATLNVQVEMSTGSRCIHALNRVEETAHRYNSLLSSSITTYCTPLFKNLGFYSNRPKRQFVCALLSSSFSKVSIARNGSKPSLTNGPSPGACECMNARSEIPAYWLGCCKCACCPRNVKYKGRGTRIVRPRGG